MKNVSKRAILTVLLAIAFVVTFACGALFTLVLNQSNMAVADDPMSSIKIDAESTTVKMGKEYKIKITLDTERDLDYATGTNESGLYWSSVSLRVGPVKADGTFDTDVSKHLNCLEDEDSGEPIISYGDFPTDVSDYDVLASDYMLYPSTTPGAEAEGFIQITIASKHNGANSKYTQKPLTFTLTLKTDASILADGENEKDITFGVSTVDNAWNTVAFGNETQTEETAASVFNKNLTVTPAQFKVVGVSSEVNLKSVNVGHDTTLPTDTSTLVECKYEDPVGTYNTTATYDCEHFAMFPLLLQTVLADDTTGAIVKVGFDSATVAASGEVVGDDGWVSLAKPADSVDTSKVYIYVQAEDCEVDESSGAVTSGKTKIYELTLSSSYVGLESLVFTDYSAMAKTTDAADGSSTAPTKVGLFNIPEAGNNEAATTFDPEVLEYKYYLLSDSFQTDGDLSLTLTLNATVPEDAGISTSIALAEVVADGGTAGLTLPDPATATSGTAFDIEAATASATYDLTLTVEKDGDSTVNKVYTIHVQVVNCDVTFDLKVTGNAQTAGNYNTYTSSGVKATQNNVDFYFALNKETVEQARTLKHKRNSGTTQLGLYKGEDIEAAGAYQGSLSGLDTNEHEDQVDLPLGTHIIVATAEAGNTRTYKFMVAMPDVLLLTLESKYQFLYEKDTGGAFKVRTAYAEVGYVHGKDDMEAGQPKAEFGRIVLGQIDPQTNLTTFMSNIEPDQLDILRLYNARDQLVYNCGAYTSDFVDLVDSNLSVGTGWYIKLGGNPSAVNPEDDKPIDIVYLSILGDVSGDGIINTNDTSIVNARIAAQAVFDTQELRLAGSMTTSCSITANDYRIFNAIIAFLDTAQNHYTYKGETTTPDPSPAP